MPASVAPETVKHLKKPTPQRRRLKAFVGLSALAVLGLVVWQHANKPALVTKLPAAAKPEVAAGQPLNTSTAAINVLTPTVDATVPDGQVSITVFPPVSAPQPPAPIVKTTPPLALLLPMIEQAYAQGGSHAKQLAALALQQAEATRPEAVDAYTALRNATPDNGPVTLPLLLVEAARAETLAPYVPAPVETSTVSGTATLTGWLRHQLGKFVTLRHAGEASPNAAQAWRVALNTAHQQLARNAPAEAAITLGQPPLAEDTRLDVLRHLVSEYADVQTRLSAVRAVTLPLVTGGEE